NRRAWPRTGPITWWCGRTTAAFLFLHRKYSVPESPALEPCLRRQDFLLAWSRIDMELNPLLWWHSMVITIWSYGIILLFQAHIPISTERELPPKGLFSIIVPFSLAIRQTTKAFPR